MKPIFTWGIIILSALNINPLKAQGWEREVKDPSNFFNLQQAFYQEEVLTNTSGEEEEDGFNEVYQRWAQWTLPRVNENGKPLAPDIIYKEWDKYKTSHNTNVMSKTTPWHYLGPISTPANGGGTGRINCIKFQPGNPNIVWVGTPAGGLWKSTDAGQSWADLTDSLPNIGVTDIIINPKNTNIIYIATGDGFGYAYLNGFFFGGNYSNGIMKSTDGGNTWNTTGLNFSQNQSHQVYKMLLNPTNSNNLLASADNGVWFTNDAGKTWSQSNLTSATFDLKYNPVNSSIVYAAGTSLYYSNDSGKTWTESKNTASAQGYSGIVLSVSPACPSSVYAMGITTYSGTNNPGYLYKSTNKGRTWSYVNQVSDLNFYGKYVGGLAVSPKDSNHIVAGGVNLAETNSGGSSWYDIASINSNFSSYVHPDHRAIEFWPGSNDSFYDGNDGGLYYCMRNSFKSYTFSLLSGGIHVLQFYGQSTADSRPTRFFGGAQDNGINRSNNNAWDHVVQGDGMLCAVNNENPNIVYANTQYGNMHKTVNGGGAFTTTSVGPFSNFYQFNWVTPIIIDPENAKMVYYGANDLYVSKDNAASWKQLHVPTNENTNNIGHIAVAGNSYNYIYVVKQSDQSANFASVYMTSNAGKNWTKITKGLPTGNLYITDIEVDKNDSQKVWLTVSGFSNGNKVYMSTDAGANWTNVSGALPNVPINCIAIENSTQNGVYLGTDIGVFYKNDINPNWTRYSDGLPNVIVNDLQVLPSINKIRAATYGRGIWDGDLAGTVSGIEKADAITKGILIYPNPSVGNIHISLPELSQKTPIINIYNMIGQKIQELMPSQNTELNIDLSNQPSGIYNIIFNYQGEFISKKVLIEK